MVLEIYVCLSYVVQVLDATLQPTVVKGSNGPREDEKGTNKNLNQLPCSRTESNLSLK